MLRLQRELNTLHGLQQVALHKFRLVVTLILNANSCFLCIVLVTWPLQPIVSDKRQNNHSFCHLRQTKRYQVCRLMCNWVSGFRFGLDIGVHYFYFLDMVCIWTWWNSFGLDRDCKISISVHHWYVVSKIAKNFAKSPNQNIYSQTLSKFARFPECGDKLANMPTLLDHDVSSSVWL